MNWDHRFNSLTPNFLFDLESAVRYLEKDPDMKAILLSDVKQNNFSSGTDLWEIAKMAKEKNLKGLHEYFV